MATPQDPGISGTSRQFNAASPVVPVDVASAAARSARPGDLIESRNPRDGGLLGTVRVDGTAETRLAVERARQASAFWADQPLSLRREYLLSLRDTVCDLQEEIVFAITSETGKVRAEAISGEIMVTADLIGFYARNLQRVLGDKPASSGLLQHKRSYTVHEPYGVVAIISPWNFPFYLLVAPVVAAVAAGNTVVMKSSELTPLVGQKTLELFQEAERRVFDSGSVHASTSRSQPLNLVSAVNGGPQTGEALVDAEVDAIAFTGSVASGTKVANKASQSLKPMLLELGGKDPMIVCSDAEVGRASSAAVWGAFCNTGQACISIERVYVHSSIYERFLSEVEAKTNALRLDRDFGPMTDPRQLESVRQHIDDAIANGASVRAGGDVFSDDGSNYLRPTVLTGVDHDMKVMREETFGPVLPVMAFDNDDEAVQLANDTVYGLSSSVFSSSKLRARSIGRRLRTGAVNVNDCLVTSATAGLPYGGHKCSGIGYTHGDEGLLAFSRLKAFSEPRVNLPREPQWYATRGPAPEIIDRLARSAFRRGISNKLRNFFD